MLKFQEGKIFLPNQNYMKNAKGTPGLAFETWDPRN
jgi:hypothetical protein